MISPDSSEELVEAYRGSKSLPFEPGERGCIAAKIVDNRRIEGLRIMESALARMEVA
jgi:adenine-specific DNA-methyltransferase